MSAEQVEERARKARAGEPVMHFPAEVLEAAAKRHYEDEFGLTRAPSDEAMQQAAKDAETE